MKYALMGLLRGIAYVRLEHEDIESFRTYDTVAMKWGEDPVKSEEILYKIMVDEEWKGAESLVEFETEEQLMYSIYEFISGLPQGVFDHAYLEALENQDPTISFAEKMRKSFGDKFNKLKSFGVIETHDISLEDGDDLLRVVAKVVMPVNVQHIEITMSINNQEV